MLDIPTFTGALERYHVLSPAQLSELQQRQLTGDAKLIARELIERGWLTPFSANLLLQGRGEELLLGSYVLLDRLGEGGMGTVYRARNWKLGRNAALKLIRKERLASPDAIRRFEREIRAAAQLDHPNVVRAYDADQVGGAHFFIMEFVDGIDLARLVREHGPLPPGLACEYIRQAALGLQHAHERGLVHRDIKPANLLLARGQGTSAVKILDMGLARQDETISSEQSATLTQVGMLMGTPDYMAPEQSVSSHTVDIRADIYSLGCSLYFLLTGSAPFPGGSLAEKLIKHQLDEPTPVQELRPDTPAAVAAVVRRLMAKKAAERLQTPRELADELGKLLNDRHVWQARPVTQFTAKKPQTMPLSEQRTDPFWAGIAHEVVAQTVEQKMPVRRSRRWLIVSAGACIVAVLLMVWLTVNAFRGNASNNQGMNAGNAKPDKKTEEGWVDLLTHDLAAIAIDGHGDSGGHWERVAGRLRSPNRQWSRVKLPVAVDRDYLLEVRIEPRWGGQKFLVLLPVAERSASVELSNRCLVRTDRDKTLSEGDMAGLGFDRISTLAITVTVQDTDATIEVRRDSALLTRWTGPIEGLGNRAWDQYTHGFIWLMPWETVTEIHSARLKRLNVATPERAARPLLALAPFDAKQASECQEAWAAHLRQPVEETNTLGMKLRLIPPGKFQMGSPSGEPGRVLHEGPQHAVHISKSFRIGVHEVTLKNFQDFVQATDYSSSTKVQHRPWDKPGWDAKENDPVVNVSWNDANAFCQWLSKKEGKTYRLPTEAEWEYACRAGTTTAFHFGDTVSGEQANCKAKTGPYLGRGTAVGSYAANAFSLYDMHGNAWEWASDWYDAKYYETSPAIDPQGPPTGDRKPLRSGGWFRNDIHCRAATREAYLVTSRFANTGFRVVCEIEQK